MEARGRQQQRPAVAEHPTNTRLSDQPRLVNHNAELLKRKKEVRKIVAASYSENAKEYEREARRVTGLLEKMSLMEQSSGDSGQIYGDLADLGDSADIFDLNQVDTSSYMVAIADLSQREWALDDQRAALLREKQSIEASIHKSVRRRIALEKLLKQLKEGESKQKEIMQSWSSQLESLRAREKTQQQEVNIEEKLGEVGFTPDISHSSIVKLEKGKAALDAQIRPIMEKLNKFGDLPPDVERAEILVLQKEQEVQEWKEQFDKKLREKIS